MCVWLSEVIQYNPEQHQQSVAWIVTSNSLKMMYTLHIHVKIESLCIRVCVCAMEEWRHIIIWHKYESSKIKMGAKWYLFKLPTCKTHRGANVHRYCPFSWWCPPLPLSIINSSNNNIIALLHHTKLRNSTGNFKTIFFL